MKCVKCLELFDFVKIARETGTPPEWQTCPLPPLRNIFKSEIVSNWSDWCDECYCDLPISERWPKCTPADLKQADQILNRRLYELRDARLAKESPKPAERSEIKPAYQPTAEVKAVKQPAAKAKPDKQKSSTQPKQTKAKSKPPKGKASSALKPGEVPAEYEFAGELFSRLYGEKSVSDIDPNIPF